MEELIVAGAAAAIWLALMGMLIVRPAYIKVRERMSPKYAAARKVRLAQKSASDEAARKQARIDESTRLKDWATENSDDETAQAYLATLSTDTQPSEMANVEEDIREVLRLRQQGDDETQERLRQRRLQEAKYLKWALENPMDPVARRHLGAALVDADNASKYGSNRDEAAKTVEAIKAALALTSTPA